MKKNKEEKKESNIKNIYISFKKAWAIPQKKAGIKLLAYFIFFVIFFLIAAIVNRTNNVYNNDNMNTITTTVTKKEDKYNDKQNKLINNSHTINYTINIGDIEYTINGELDNNVISGYLESNETIKKILIEDNRIYEIKNNEKKDLDIDFNIKLININNIMNIIKNSKTIIERKEEDTNYLYTVNIDDNEVNIKIYTSEESINKIELFDETDKYILNFDK